MKTSTKYPKSKIFYLLAWGLFICLCTLFFLKIILPIFHPEVISLACCNENGNLYINGSYTFNSAFYMPSVDKIFIVNEFSNPQEVLEIPSWLNISDVPSSSDRGLIIHERCHQQQHYRNVSFNELECYYKQYFGGN